MIFAFQSDERIFCKNELCFIYTYMSPTTRRASLEFSSSHCAITTGCSVQKVHLSAAALLSNFTGKSAGLHQLLVMPNAVQLQPAICSQLNCFACWAEWVSTGSFRLCPPQVAKLHPQVSHCSFPVPTGVSLDQEKSKRPHATPLGLHPSSNVCWFIFHTVKPCSNRRAWKMSKLHKTEGQKSFCTKSEGFCMKTSLSLDLHEIWELGQEAKHCTMWMKRLSILCVGNSVRCLKLRDTCVCFSLNKDCRVGMYILVHCTICTYLYLYNLYLLASSLEASLT